MSDAFKNLAEISRHYGVSAPAVTGWTRKDTWPGTLDKATVDRFFQEIILPHRKVKKPAPPAMGVPSIPPPPPATQQAPGIEPAPPSATGPLPDDVATASIEELERRIRQATSSEQAERLSKQVRALKVIREIQERDKVLMDASKARAEIRSVFHLLQSALMNLARSAAPSLEGLLSTEIEVVLEGRVVEMLGELKRGLQRVIEFEAESATVVGSTRSADPAREAKAEPDGGEVPDPESAPIIATGQME